MEKPQISQEELKKAELVAKYWARCWSRGNRYLYDDLFQEGYLGIMEAVKYYDASKNVKFSSYAYYWIRKKVIAYAQKNFLPISLPAVFFDKIMKNMFDDDSKEEVVQKYGPAITYYSVAYSTGNGFRDACEQERGTLDLSYNPEDEFIQKIHQEELSEEIKSALRHLPANERQVIELRFGLAGKEPMYFWQIGKEMGFSRQRAHQLYLKALDKLKKILANSCFAEQYAVKTNIEE